MLKICKINFDYRNAIYLDMNEGFEDFDFTIKQPVITNVPVSILIKAFRLRFPDIMIKSLSIDKGTFQNPLTDGIIPSMSDYRERKETFQ